MNKKYLDTYIPPGMHASLSHLHNCAYGKNKSYNLYGIMQESEYLAISCLTNNLHTVKIFSIITNFILSISE
ncbi:hypothetical protein SAMN05421781_0392 [Marinococcus luteus]|uniref:Uncharacterized protein n=1 Tax=Marinococcus luteus TaxID=1122204 RepID=A0A1H2QMX4_9BACI|nr:hypothetical protein SAMN05421781_0392 [Marinococcus luteus]